MVPILATGAILALSLPHPVAAENSPDTDDDTRLQTVTSLHDKDEDDTPDVETESTIDTAEQEAGLYLNGDLRPIATYSDLDDRDGLSTSEEALGVRFRLGTDVGITTRSRVGVRLAGRCSTDGCGPDFVLDSAIPESRGIADGEITLDQLYAHWFVRDRFDVALGRLQTRFVLRGGVFAKSLDRSNGHNVNVNWTDGFHATLRGPRGWAGHLVLERNVADGSGSIRRAPLDFEDSGSRVTYFVGVENNRPRGSLVQRAIDVSYLPDSLLKDGTRTGRLQDYWGVVGRVVLRWPQRSEGIRLRAGAEVGYAPEVPTSAAAGIDDDVDRVAWNVVASIMDFRPGHSLGMNYGRTGAGWLLSPQFRPNDELFELRYQWRSRRPLLEARVRWREDLEQPTGAAQKRDQFDFFLRLTWQFDIKGPG